MSFPIAAVGAGVGLAVKIGGWIADAFSWGPRNPAYYWFARGQLAARASYDPIPWRWIPVAGDMEFLGTGDTFYTPYWALLEHKWYACADDFWGDPRGGCYLPDRALNSEAVDAQITPGLSRPPAKPKMFGTRTRKMSHARDPRPDSPEAWQWCDVGAAIWYHDFAHACGGVLPTPPAPPPGMPESLAREIAACSDALGMMPLPLVPGIILQHSATVSTILERAEINDSAESRKMVADALKTLSAWRLALRLKVESVPCERIGYNDQRQIQRIINRYEQTVKEEQAHPTRTRPWWFGPPPAPWAQKRAKDAARLYGGLATYYYGGWI